MSTNTYDFNALLRDAKAGGAWPQGQYDFEVVEATAKTASTGSPMVVTKLRCISGEKAGKSITNNFVLTVDNPTALNMFFRHMAAFGLDASFFTQIGTGTLDPVASNLVGRRARVKIGHRQWNGSTQNNVEGIEPLVGGPAGAPGPTAGVPTPAAGVPTPGVPAGFPPVPSPASAPAPSSPAVPSPSPVQPSAPQPSTSATPPPVPGVPAVPAVPTPTPAAAAPPVPATPVPAPQAEAPAPTPADNGAAATPPGMTPEAYQQFLQWQAQQAQAAQPQGGQAPPPLPV